MSRKPLVIGSPKEDLAEKELTAIEEASIRIKELIVKGYLMGILAKELSKLIDAEIAKAVASISNERLKEEVKRGLIQSANKWHYQYKQSIKVLDSNLIKEATRLNIAPALKIIDVSLGSEHAKVEIVNEIRNKLTDNAKGLPLIKDYEKKVKEQLRLLASEPPTTTILRQADGKPRAISLRNIAEQRVRFEAQQKDLQKLDELGIDLVWVSSHADASKRCEPWQGRLYSRKGNSGIKEGEPYTSLQTALEANDGNSIISGYNCRHHIIEWFSGSRPPNQYSSAEVKKERAIDIKQRNMENRIRQLKREEKMYRSQGLTNDAAKKREIWRMRYQEYQKFSLENERAYYPWRTRVSSEEEF